MLKVKNLIIFFIIVLLANISFADAKSDLNKKKNELNKLQNTLSSKKAEKEKLLKQENKYKQELKNISKTISKNQKEMDSLKLKIKNVEKNLDTASTEYSRASDEKQAYIEQINKKVLEYVKQESSSYFSYPLHRKIQSLVICDDVASFHSASDRSLKAKNEIDKFSKSKQDFLSLKSKKQNILNKNMDIQKNKNKQLKTTADKRAKAEKEIRDMDNSKKALESLISKLKIASANEQKKAKTTTSKYQNANVRKNNLPWPVDGKVILKYGKNKHPELDTVIVSNGIKIKAQNGAIIKSIDDGSVVFTGEFKSYGKMIIVDHKGNYFSIYGQLKDILVKQNKAVTRQEPIATVGSGNNSVLYLEIRQCNSPENPLMWLEEKK